MKRYCKRCYASLANAVNERCAKCSRAFDAEDAKTYLTRPFPPLREIVTNFVVITIVGAMVAFVVALHQITGASGH